MLKVIINADDFGLTSGCNHGIVQAMTQGVVRDTTLLVNAEKANEAVLLAKQNGINKVGLHLNLTYGKPILPSELVASLVDANGQFYRSKGNLHTNINLAQVESEFRAQIEKFLQTGLQLTHFDSHHHVHARPEIIDMVVALAKEYKVPVRQVDAISKGKITKANLKTTDYFVVDFYGDCATLEYLENVLDKFEDGTLEIMSHPAAYDPQTYAISSYHTYREQELAVLTSRTLLEYISARQIQLISFSEL